MSILRTPEEQFNNLPDYPFKEHYITVSNDYRMHYVDEGSGSETILCLHGQPSWSFLYRKIITALSPKYRVIAPDLIGFGKSDKPSELEDYSFFMHYDSLLEFISKLDLQNITLVCQDWGGVFGLPIASTEFPERFSRLVIMNTGLPTGDVPVSDLFKQWKQFTDKVGRNLQPGKLLQMSSSSKLSEDVLQGYDAPYPDPSYKAGVAVFPRLTPTQEDHAGAKKSQEAREALRHWQKPALVMFSDNDPITADGEAFFRKIIPTAKENPEIVIEAGHFLQEEKPLEIAQHIETFIENQ